MFRVTYLYSYGPDPVPSLRSFLRGRLRSVLLDLPRHCSVGILDHLVISRGSSSGSDPPRPLSSETNPRVPTRDPDPESRSGDTGTFSYRGESRNQGADDNPDEKLDRCNVRTFLQSVVVVDPFHTQTTTWFGPRFGLTRPIVDTLEPTRYIGETRS